MNSTNSSPPQSVQESPSAGDNAATSSAVSTLAPERVPLPQRSTPPPQPDMSGADLLLASFLVLLAFLLASTPVRNSDFWLHLATGRAIADGSYRFQGDPFSQDANNWIAHSWLYDLLTFELFTHVGGTVLVLLKAGLVALLAELLLRLGKRERGLLWPVLAVTLSVLAMSGRLPLQPALLSAVLLAVTLLLLNRGRRLRCEQNAGWLLAYGPICALFALWANLDDWFLLGPLTVALCLIGELLATGIDKVRGDVAGLALTLGAGLLACLLTPFHVHGLTLPPELGLSATARALQQDPVLQNLFLSPFSGNYFHSGVAWSIPGLAYLILAVLSALSFAGNRDARHSWRLPVWIGMFTLSAWSVRAVPFFAVVAGPILALNVQDLAQKFRPEWLRRDEMLYGRFGRAVAILLLLVLLGTAWPGWIQGAPYEMRRWVVLEDPSLCEAAKQLDEMRQNGKLTDADRGFHFSPEEANYFAWFCPAQKGIVDARLQVSPETAADYVTVRRVLLDESPLRADWRRVLRARHISHVVVYDVSSERVQRVYQRLVQDGQEWVPISLTGRTAIFGWKDAQRPELALKLEKLRLPVKTEAYHPTEGKKAPRSWPERDPEPPAWWSDFVASRPAGAVDRDEAALLLLNFETRSSGDRRQNSLAWDASRIAGVVGAGGIGGGMTALGVRMQQSIDLFCYKTDFSETPIRLTAKDQTLEKLAYVLHTGYVISQDDAPPEYLWLAIRAARRAVHDNPNDAHAYFILGESYLRMLHSTRERAWKTQLPILRRLRQVQASTALNHALLLQPDLLAAHNSLALLYQDMRLWDLRLKHRREVLRLTKARGPIHGENFKDWQEAVTRLEEEVNQLDQEMTQALEQFDVNSANSKIIDRAEKAASYGLGGKTLEILLGSDAASFGKRGIELELHLLLTTGRVREVRAWMSPDLRRELTDEVYLQDRLELAVASGDYDQADADLAEWISIYDAPEEIAGAKLSIRESMALAVANEVLQSRLDTQTFGFVRSRVERTKMFVSTVSHVTERLRRIADLTVLRGLLALERGDTELTRKFLERALTISRSEGGLDFGSRPIAEYYVTILSNPAR